MAETMAAASEGVPLRRKKNPALIRCERPSITRAAASVLPLNDGRPDASAESKGDGADGCKLTFRRLIRRHGLVPADPSGRAGGSSYFHWNQRRLFFLGEESQLVDQEAQNESSAQSSTTCSSDDRSQEAPLHRQAQILFSCGRNQSSRAAIMIAARLFSSFVGAPFSRIRRLVITNHAAAAAAAQRTRADGLSHSSRPSVKRECASSDGG